MTNEVRDLIKERFDVSYTLKQMRIISRSMNLLRRQLQIRKRVWSLKKQTLIKNTTKIKANTFGFYALNGDSLVDFKKHSKKEDVCEFLEEIRDNNPGKNIVIVLDNFRSHHAKMTMMKAEELDERLVFLPSYSPDLNPIEFIWKSVKRVISPLFIKSRDDLTEIIRKSFARFSKSLSFSKEWIGKFTGESFKSLIY